MFKETFRGFIDEAMDRAPITVAEMADRLGVEPSYVSQVKNGHRSFPMKDLQTWAGLLNIDGNPRKLRRFRWLSAITKLPKETRDEFVWLVNEVEKFQDLATAIRLQAEREGKI